MKKLLIILGILLGINLIIISAGKAFALNYDTTFKNNFYDSFLLSTWASLKESLLSQGFEANSVDKYISKMQQKLNRTQLENDTWGCVKNYTVEQMMEGKVVYNNCFSSYMNKFFFVTGKNELSVLKKQ